MIPLPPKKGSDRKVIASDDRKVKILPKKIPVTMKRGKVRK